MPSDLQDKKLSDLLTDELASELKLHGEAKAGMFGPILRAKYPDIAREYAESIFDGAVSRMAAGKLKSWFSVSLAGETQLSLPGIPADVLSEIPPTIAVPSDGGEVRHVLLSRVTVKEFKNWERMLGEQIKNDQRKHRAARFIVARIKDCEDDMMLSAAFSPAEVDF